MQWNDHSRLTGQHAFLGASKYHWLNYDAQRLADAYLSFQAKEKGTRLHAFAAECITLRQKLPKSKKTLNADALQNRPLQRAQSGTDEAGRGTAVGERGNCSGWCGRLHAIKEKTT